MLAALANQTTIVGSLNHKFRGSSSFEGTKLQIRPEHCGQPVVCKIASTYRKGRFSVFPVHTHTRTQVCLLVGDFTISLFNFCLEFHVSIQSVEILFAYSLRE